MTDTKAIQELVNSRGIKWTHIAQQMGISKSALTRKVNAEREFTVDEVAKFADAVGGMTRKEIWDYFFTPLVDDSSTKGVTR